MIEKDIDTNLLKDIFKEYKKEYNPIINEFTKIYVYKIDNKIVGFLIFSILYGKCEIIDIYVSKNYRRNHIAENLMNAVIRDYTVDNITLEVSEKNIGAIKLYEKLGFKKVAIRKNYYADSDGLLMLKEVR